MLHSALVWLLFPFWFTPVLTVPVTNYHSNKLNIETIATTSSDVIVRTGTDASTTTFVLHAPYGVKSEIESINGKTYSTTTPITKEDIKQMEKQQERFQKQMDKMLQDQQKLFGNMSMDF